MPSFSPAISPSFLLDTDDRPLRVFHGTRNAVFDAFKPAIRKHEQAGFGIHFARDRDFAERYALDEHVARAGKHPFVYEAHLAIDNLLVANAIYLEGTPGFDLGMKLAGRHFYAPKDEAGRRGLYLQNAVDATSPQRAARILQEAGYDGMSYLARIRVLGVGSATLVAESESFLVFRPEQVTIVTGPGLVSQPEMSTSRRMRMK